MRDRQAGDYDAHIAADAYVHAVEDECLFAALDLSHEHDVLDAGCGTGRHFDELLRRGRSVIGVDHSEESLAVALARTADEDRGRLRLLQGDLRELPLEDGVVDRVMCCGVLQHFPTSELRLQVVQELGRVLRPDGCLVLSAYRWLGRVKRHRDGFWGEGLYRHAFTCRELRTLIGTAGFEPVEVGGIAIFPGLAERLGVTPARHARLMFTPAGRHLAQYVVARARKP